MRAFVRIGPIKSNTSGLGSRGWCIARRGTDVVTLWGGVEVVSGGGKTRIYWAAGWPSSTTYRRRTTSAANALVKNKIAEQTGTSSSGGYQRLPARARIYVRRRGGR